MERFWIRAMRKTVSKYLGWDLRIIPTISLLGVIASIILIDMPLWGRLALGYILLGILFVCFSLAMRDIWKEDTDKMSFAYNIQVVQENNPMQFIAIEPHTLYVEGDEQIRHF